MGACRETQNIFYYIKNKNYKYAFNLTKRMIKYRDKTTYEDTFMPIVCRIKGHKAYQPDPDFEPEDWACKRCHRFIKYNPRKEKLKALKKFSKNSK
jgi:hypothetical protein